MNYQMKDSRLIPIPNDATEADTGKPEMSTETVSAAYTQTLIIAY